MQDGTCIAPRGDVAPRRTRTRLTFFSMCVCVCVRRPFFFFLAAGAIYSSENNITLDGDAIFTNNKAASNGGETRSMYGGETRSMYACIRMYFYHPAFSNYVRYEGQSDTIGGAKLRE